MTLDLGPNDYLIYPTVVHVMRYMGHNDNGNRSWRPACGTRFSEQAWADGFGYAPSLEEIERYDLAVCLNCARTKARR